MSTSNRGHDRTENRKKSNPGLPGQSFHFSPYRFFFPQNDIYWKKKHPKPFETKNDLYATQ